jgi:hypothetical protein
MGFEMHLIRILALCLSLTCAAASADQRKGCLVELESSSAEAEVAHVVATAVEQDLKIDGFMNHETRGYSILVATMVASAVATTYLSSSLPPHLQFVSQFLAQVSTLGVYVIGSPIWDPLRSQLRKLAFGIRKSDQANSEMGPAFEAMWRRTQEAYSVNAQMSRNLATQFLLLAKLNFYEAHRAMQSENPIYSADQVADAAYRMKTYFTEIQPEDPSVASAVRTAFTNHVKVDAAFLALVETRIRALDETYFASEESQLFYSRLLKTWLTSIP